MSAHTHTQVSKVQHQPQREGVSCIYEALCFHPSNFTRSKNHRKSSHNMEPKYFVLRPECTGRFRTGCIKPTKIIQPVLGKAMEKAEGYKKQLIQKNKRKIQRTTIPEQRKALEEQHTKAYKEVYDTSLNGIEPDKIMFPADAEALLEYLSKKYLFIHPNLGIKMILEAYHEYYGTGDKCEWCRKPIISSPNGRKKKYCCDACRQKAYRARKRKRG